MLKLFHCRPGEQLDCIPLFLESYDHDDGR